ncbi:PREDICTED: uncharacterized protein LOC108551870 [Eufriesea mexicana]|uniref:uncharacterized protein LOC108551870 n=1 Tax=Eufriesea mexicana TaxID=516756 RepID=UPI00083C77D1|nr:PREDICTED: uncharacterized protein LOC108551870 [Eufriesea mexicana]
MYVYQFPVLFIGIIHTSFVSLLIKLVLHVCGKFAILSYRIQNMSITSHVNLNTKIKEFVIVHITLITTANIINSAFQIFFLIELLQISIRISVVIYMLIIDSSGNFVKTITHILYVVMITSMLYLYSFIGEQLSQESMKVSEAFYNTDWDNLSVHNQKLFLLALSCGRQTLHVTAGKFYTFSLYGFIDIMKTSFGYVSLLRALT